MNNKVLEEIRDSLNEIKALATPVMVVTADYTPEQERQLRESLGKHKFVDVRPVEVSQIKSCFRPEHRDIHDIVHAINLLAMANTDVINVFADFSGHINCFRVDADPKSTVYEEGVPRVRLMREYVYLDHDGALEKLLSIESQLTELIIEAREEAEAKAEVEA
ncbi:hypothetical protein [Vibrio diabolicus]|uniref:hypothetical protein n=1 Tax=Vibrio diabolicus TaxID=50719 RepID=UPI0014281740|nr:hypothetical protein [Vibrio diabolicus]QIS00594.1 hypothetical protein FR741_23010 [Vibrio diabolicus]